MASFIANIKIKIGRIILARRMKKVQRNAQFRNFETSKKIGLIFNATEQSTYDKARKFIKLLKQKNLQVNALGFVDSKEVLDFFKSESDLNFFSRKNLNWFGKPNNPNTQEFIENQFDILIDLSLVEDFPILYIVGLSKADFKVGCVKETANYYDFMIDLGEQKDLDVFIKQINNYLQMIQ